MAITKTTEVDKIEVVGEYKAIQVRTATIIKEDDTEISKTFGRHVIHPHMDISGETAEVQAVANAVWTDDVKAAWQTHQDNYTGPGA
tara:strand:- start:82 stop:342 length:261 start_codon:yes stop_codon:yes gene_type:complete